MGTGEGGRTGKRPLTHRLHLAHFGSLAEVVRVRPEILDLPHHVPPSPPTPGATHLC